MRLVRAPLSARQEIAPGAYLLEVHAPQLAQAAQPGQYCMVRCCDSLASDPLLRRPLFVHDRELARGMCSFLVSVRGRGSAWLVRQQPGIELDILGPLGHGWRLQPQARTLLLIGEDPVLAPLIFLARHALAQDLAVTLVYLARNDEVVYPPALLPPEVEYQVLAHAAGETAQLREYTGWADAICCSVSRETLLLLGQGDPAWRAGSSVQVALWPSLICGSGMCQGCFVETRRGPRLVCREGPIFAFNELADY